MTKFLTLFGVTLLGLFTLELLNPVQLHVIQPFTSTLASISAALILPFDTDVISMGRILRDAQSGFAVSIEAGCNGVEASIVLIAGIVAFPAQWHQKLAAILLGFIAIQVLNIGRIISLFYLGQWSLEVFEWFHLYFWPILIMVDVLIVFAVYLRWLARCTPRTAEIAVSP
jgi:exosortase H (IPTLxxWG-CTERM-specific)